MKKSCVLLFGLVAAIATAPSAVQCQVSIIILSGTNILDYRVLNTNFNALNIGISNVQVSAGSWPLVSQAVTEASSSWPLVSQAVTEASSSWPLVSQAVTEASSSWPLVSQAVTEASSSWPAVSGAVTAAANSWPAVSGAVTAAAASWPAVSGAVTAAAGSWPAVSGAVTAAAGSWPAVSGAVVLASTPIGGIIQYGNSNAPTGWLLCDGGGSHTNAFAALHAVIGYQFGGSGTNFLRPDLRRRMAAGMGSGYNLGASGGYENVTLTIEQMPSHTHRVAYSGAAGSVGKFNTYNMLGLERPDALCNFSMLATGGDKSHSNMPPYIVLNSIIFAGK